MGQQWSEDISRYIRNHILCLFLHKYVSIRCLGTSSVNLSAQIYARKRMPIKHLQCNTNTKWKEEHKKSEDILSTHRVCELIRVQNLDVTFRGEQTVTQQTRVLIKIMVLCQEGHTTLQ